MFFRLGKIVILVLNEMEREEVWNGREKKMENKKKERGKVNRLN